MIGFAFPETVALTVNEPEGEVVLAYPGPVMLTLNCAYAAASKAPIAITIISNRCKNPFRLNITLSFPFDDSHRSSRNSLMDGSAVTHANAYCSFDAHRTLSSGVSVF